MKKLLFLPAVLLLITGCGEKSMSCTIEKEHEADGYKTSSVYTIKYKGDYVKELSYTETATSDDNTILDNLKEIQEEVHSNSKKNYGGYDYEIKKEGNTLSVKVTLNCDNFNFDKYLKDYPAEKSYIVDGKMTLKGITEKYESNGATCKDIQ